MIVFALIPLIWLAIACVVVVLCRAASRGDDSLALEAAAHTASPGVTLWTYTPPARHRGRGGFGGARGALRAG